MSEKRAVNVIDRLEELNLTNREFAKAAGVSERAVYHWLSYERVPRLTFAQVANICSLLNWTIQELADAYHPGDQFDSQKKSPARG